MIKRHSLFFLAFILLALGCKKDGEIEATSNCPNFKDTKTSYAELTIQATTNDDLYEEVYDVDVSQLDQGVDIDCDGYADFTIQSHSKSEYPDGFYTDESELTFTIHSPYLTVLTSTHNNTFYYKSTTDTIGSTIYSSSGRSTSKSPGATVESVYTNTYVAGLQEGAIIQADDSGWKAEPVRMSYYKRYAYDYYGMDGEYTIDAEVENITSMGLINSENNYIALKYEGNKGVKIGYLKLDILTYLSHVKAGFYFRRMHR